MDTRLAQYGIKAAEHLTKDLLPWWRTKDSWKEKNAFYGWLDGQGNPSKGEDMPWHCVLYSRLLWTFSAAARFTGDASLLEEAAKVYSIYHSHFLDKEYGGSYWFVSPNGSVISDRKQTYGQAFWIYGLSEYYLASGKEEALNDAMDIFNLLQAHVRDPIYGGPVESRNRDWSETTDYSLNKDVPPVPKSMNTHLHVLEAYTNLLRAKRTPEIESATREVLNNFLDYVTHPDGFFHQFLEMDYTPLHGAASYGHDIEGSWLLWEAAEVIGDPALLEKSRPYCIALADRPFRYGIDPDGGIIDEGDYEGNPVHTDKVWWSQAEACVGQLNCYQLTGDEKYLEGSLRSWGFIERHIMDHVYGEWFMGVNRDATKTHNEEKAGPWKCSYHNSRACMEISRRVKEIAEGKVHHP